MVSRWLAFLIWALVAATAVAWLLRLSASPQAVPATAVSVDNAGSFRKDWTRLFGAPAPEAAKAEAAVSPLASRLKLIGLVAPRAPAGSPNGLALISVDGKPARAYRVGASVDGDLVVQSVHARAVDVGPRGAASAVTLELPPMAAAATGTLPAASRLGAPTPAVPGAADAAPQVPDAAQQPGAIPQPAPPMLQPMPVVPQQQGPGAPGGAPSSVTS